MTNPLRIAIVLDELLKWQGGVEYVRNLLLALRERRAARPEDPVTVLVLATGQVPARVEAAYRPLADEWLTGLEGGPGLYLELIRLRADLAFPLYCDETTAVRYAHWIYDFQHKALADFFSPADQAAKEKAMADIVRFAEHIVVSSEVCRRDLERYYPAAAGRARVVRFATFPDPAWREPDAAAVAASYHLPERYLILCNQFWKHKNHADVFAALARLNEGGERIDLVCTGGLHDYRQPDHVNDLVAGLHRVGLAGQVQLLGLLPRADQLQLVRRAVAMVQPSGFEGWSTVVEDARTFGKTIVLSDIDVHREQDPPHGRFFALGDVEALAKEMAMAWQEGAPGPDPAREDAAYAEGRRRAAAFAEHFVELARAPRVEMRPPDEPAAAARDEAAPEAADGAEVAALRERLAALDEDRRQKSRQLVEKDKQIRELAAACQLRDAEYKEVFALRNSKWMKTGWRLGLLPRLAAQPQPVRDAHAAPEEE